MRPEQRNDRAEGAGSSASDPEAGTGSERRLVRHRLRRGVYLLPSLFTMGNIVLGFYALVRGIRGNPELRDFENAALIIFIAAILDGLDGRIARMTHTESDFGREFDSLADLFTFGVVPAVLAHLWGLAELGRIGWLIPLFFLICTAIRLARFNVQTKIVDNRFFVGLPSPAAAGFIASFLFVAPDVAWRTWLEVAMLVALVGVGSLMISTFRYPSFKRFDLRQRWSYRFALPWAAGILALAFHPPAFFLSAAVAYTAMGPGGWLLGRLRHRASGSGTTERMQAP